MKVLFIGFLIPFSITLFANANCDKNTKLKELPIGQKVVSVILKKDVTVGAFYRSALAHDIALVLREERTNPQLLKAGRKVRIYRVDYSFLYAYDQTFEYFAFHAGKGRASWIENQTVLDFELASNRKLGIICEDFKDRSNVLLDKEDY